MENEQSLDGDLKKRLLRRMVLALVILAGLMGSLVIFDHLNAPEAPLVTRKHVVTPPLAASAAIEAAPLAAAKTEAVLASPTVNAGGLALPPLPAAASIEVGARMPPHSPLRHDPQPTVAGQDRLQRSSGDAAEYPFVLQLGVFSKPANAEVLRARLEQNGIPASIDARVRVGPFATRAAVEAARLKLKELGLSDSMVIPMKSRKSPRNRSNLGAGRRRLSSAELSDSRLG